jgi:hypothetical protein
VLRAVQLLPHPPSHPLAVSDASIAAAFASESSLTHNPTSASDRFETMRKTAAVRITRIHPRFTNPDPRITIFAILPPFGYAPKGGGILKKS